MADLPARSRRIIGLALFSSAGLLLVMAAAIYAGVMPMQPEIKDVVASVLGAVAGIDLLLGFWFVRSSLSS